MIYDFKESLALSQKNQNLPLWEESYRKLFPEMATMVNHPAYGYWQTLGIDRSIILKSSKQILIDDKIRGRSKITDKVYGDILLEYVSNDRTNAPGWVCKPLLADYIAYVIAPLGNCYLLPVIQLQQAWIVRGQHWLKKNGTIRTQNKNYSTLSVPVPVNVLFYEIGQTLRCKFKPFET